jgi:hypothetical protein
VIWTSQLQSRVSGPLALRLLERDLATVGSICTVSLEKIGNRPLPTTQAAQVTWIMSADWGRPVALQGSELQVSYGPSEFQRPGLTEMPRAKTRRFQEIRPAAGLQTGSLKARRRAVTGPSQVWQVVGPVVCTATWHSPGPDFEGKLRMWFEYDVENAIMYY